MSDLHDLQREILKLHRETLALQAQHPEAMEQIEKLRQSYSTSAPSTPPVSPVPQTQAQPQKTWKYVGEDGLIPTELSQQAARNPALFNEILAEVQQLADEAKRQD